jgi:rubrerythrin
MRIEGTETERNLMAAFAGESQARNRYTYFASKARKEGYRQISEIFEETANQEREHAKRLFKFMHGGETEITASFPSGVVGNTLENLKASAAGENYEWSDMYPSFAEVARDEGLDRVAKAFEAIAIAEKQHEKRYLALADNVANGRVFERNEPVVWRCINCGYLQEGKSARSPCPACAHPQEHFEILADNW